MSDARLDVSIARAFEAEPKVSFAIVFGSVARGSDHAGSDLDVAIGLAPGAMLSPQAIGGLVSRLEQETGRTVDLVLLDSAPPGLAYRAFRDGEIVLERDHARLVERKARAILEYLDFRPTEEILVGGALRAAARGR